MRKKIGFAQLNDGTVIDLYQSERGAGSVALSGLADAKRADEPDRAEEEGAIATDPQSLAVSPGLARDALQWASVQAFNAAVDRDSRARICAFRGLKDGESFHKEQAARFCSYGDALSALVPKPDSEQPR